MKKRMICLVVFSLTGCSPSSLSEYRTEGEGHIKKLVEELAEIESVSQLEAKQVKLKKRFTAMVDLMIAAKKFQLKHAEDGQEITPWQLEMSNALKRELIRIYQLEGCAEKFEEIERDTMHRLDLFEKSKSY